MSAHGSFVGSLLLTMVICLPLTDTWLSSMTLQPCPQPQPHAVPSLGGRRLPVHPSDLPARHHQHLGSEHGVGREGRIGGCAHLMSALNVPKVESYLSR